jgi:hypothetical protein
MVGQLERLGNMQTAYVKGKRHFDGTRVNGRIIKRHILTRQAMRV